MGYGVKAFGEERHHARTLGSTFLLSLSTGDGWNGVYGSRNTTATNDARKSGDGGHRANEFLTDGPVVAFFRRRGHQSANGEADSDMEGGVGAT